LKWNSSARRLRDRGAEHNQLPQEYEVQPVRVPAQRERHPQTGLNHHRQRKGDGEKSGEDFWVKVEKFYYTAFIGYIFYEGRDDEKNFIILLDMINASEAREDNEEFKNPVDLMFDKLL
jgi:hypothetical protein